jgi:alpha-glucosidase
VQDDDPASVLNYTRRFLAARKASAALRLGEIAVLDAPDPILAFTRTEGRETVLCVFNMSAGDAAFGHSGVGKASVWDIGCGDVRTDGDTLTLGPFAAWFGVPG